MNIEAVWLELETITCSLWVIMKESLAKEENKEINIRVSI